MDRITRKALKGDRFADEVSHSLEYVADHRRQSILYGSIAVVVLVLAIGGYFFWRHRQTAAHDELAKAFETYRAPVTEEDRPGSVTFKTDTARFDAALKDFQKVASDYSSSQEGKIGNYYIGLIYYQQGKMADAEKQLLRVSDDGQANIASLGRLTLAEVYAAEGKDAEARKTWDYLIKNPTETVPAPRAQMSMVHYLRYRNPEEAKKMLQDLMKQPGPAASSAAALLREMGQV